MEAMILAAGLGTRLRPLTNDRPKALVEVGGVSMLERVARRLVEAGATRLIVNVHHHADMVERLVEEREGFGAEVRISREPDEPLGTGGALAHAAPLFEKAAPFLLHNVDLVTTVDLAALHRRHVEASAREGAVAPREVEPAPESQPQPQPEPEAEAELEPEPESESEPESEPESELASGADARLLATLAVNRRDTSRPLLVDDLGMMGVADRRDGWRGEARAAVGEVRELGFTGIHVISPVLFDLFDPERESGKFSIWDPYLRLIERGWRIAADDVSDARWMDIGTPERLAAAREAVASGS